MALILFSGTMRSEAQDTTAQAPCAPPLLFVSDTQEPMWVETLWLKPHDNRRATEALFKDLMTQQPTDLFLLGDVVNLGHNRKRWTLVDTAIAAARSRGFRVYGILGNHELMGRARAGERNFQMRFPDHLRTGYCVRKDSVAVVLLNSNFSKLSREAIRTQDEWYRAMLAGLDTAADVRTVIVCCHHSPYSSSKLVGSNEDVRSHFVQPFMKAGKTTLFISGHAHLFQHFTKSDKHFFVIGGGGGLHHPINQKPGTEVSLEPDYDPMFHYLAVRYCDGFVTVESRALREDCTACEVGRTFQLGPLPVR